MKNKKRYFIVASVSNVNGGYMYSMSSYETDGGYVSAKEFRDKFEESYDEVIKGSTTITNIIEVSKQDFIDYRS